jgi:vesicle coat complex subunit
MFRKREVLKKVIAYMTLGIDVTRLFSDMVMVSSTAAAATTRSYRYRN